MRVIINADDLGATEAVNDAILELMARKCVTSATLLANGPAITKVVRELVHFPYCSFGIHLNITEYWPISSEKGLTPILDKTGAFNGVLNTNPKGIGKRFSLLAAIAREWSSQIESLLAQRIKLSHFDSHHHVHTLPVLFPVLKYLQRRFGIRKARISKNIYRPCEQVSKAKSTKKFIYNNLLRYIDTTTTTSGFTDFLTFFDNAKQNNIQHETVEIMVHPGQITEDIAEHELLSSPWKESIPYEVELINYNQL